MTGAGQMPEMRPRSNLDRVRRSLPGSSGVWGITSGYPALSAHVVCAHDAEADMLLARVNRLLRREYDIEHTTIQIEPATPPRHDEPMDHPVAHLE